MLGPSDSISTGDLDEDFEDADETELLLESSSSDVTASSAAARSAGATDGPLFVRIGSGDNGFST